MIFLRISFNLYSRSSHQRCSVKKSFHKNFPEACHFMKKRLQHRCFPVKFAKFLKTPILKNTSGRLLLLFLSHLCMMQLQHLSSCNNFQTVTPLKLQHLSGCNTSQAVTPLRLPCKISCSFIVT